MLRPGDPRDLIGDLLAQPLLQLQAMRKLVRNPREFRETQHFVVGVECLRHLASPRQSTRKAR